MAGGGLYYVEAKSYQHTQRAKYSHDKLIEKLNELDDLSDKHQNSTFYFGKLFYNYQDRLSATQRLRDAVKATKEDEENPDNWQELENAFDDLWNNHHGSDVITLLGGSYLSFRAERQSYQPSVKMNQLGAAST